MKSLQLILAFLLSTTIFSQSADFVFPELDQALIGVWRAAEEERTKDLREVSNHLSEIWEAEKRFVSALPPEYLTRELFIIEVSCQVLEIQEAAALQDFVTVRNTAQELLLAFWEIRDCYDHVDYSLDVLLDLLDDVVQIEMSVNDVMFDKMEWYEFEFYVRNAVRNYDYYAGLSDSDLTDFFPGMNLDRHHMLRDKLASCIMDFLYSLEEAYQPDFVKPCDEMGNSLQQLIFFYSEDIQQ